MNENDFLLNCTWVLISQVQTNEVTQTLLQNFAAIEQSVVVATLTARLPPIQLDQSSEPGHLQLLFHLPFIYC